jgi:hypothetical protein
LINATYGTISEVWEEKQRVNEWEKFQLKEHKEK